jgi:hypothetical protein
MPPVNICEQAEAFRLLLIMGIASKAEVIAWADERILADEHPPEWLLDLSLAANATDDVFESRLRDLPCEGNRTAAAFTALDRFAEAFRAAKISPRRAALMLQWWAASANVNEEDRTQAMIPIWVADEIEYDNASEWDVVETINRSLAHFAAVRRTG